MEPINSDAYGVAALAVVSAIVLQLIEKNVLTKDQVAETYAALTQIKMDKGMKHSIAIEVDAAKLIATMAADLESRLE